MQTRENHRRFAGLSELILRDVWKSNPVGATIRGIHDYDHTFGDVSEVGFLAWARRFKEHIRSLQSEVDPEALSPSDRLDYHSLLSLASGCLTSLESQRFWMKDPGAYASNAIWGCFGLLAYEFAPLEERINSMLSRIREIPDMLAISRANIADAPRVFVETTIETLPHICAFFRDAVPQLADRTPTLREDLIRASEEAHVAIGDYGKWLSEELLSGAKGDFAVGSSVYEQLLHSTHCLTYSPDELLRLGHKVLEESLQLIRETAREIDPSVTWQELVNRLKADHPSKDELLEAYRSAAMSAREFVMERDLVSIPPDETLDVRDTPEFERCLMPYAAYFPPAPFDESRQGAIWVTPVDEEAPEEHQKSQLLGHCSYVIPIIALHEGYPGHHLQLTRACNMKSAVRKQMASNLLIEGWALYCEEMMNEQGFYTDPRVRLFQLKGLLWRACRVIIDVGLHTGQMSVDEAVDMLVDTAHLERINARAEVRRYTMTPTQPMTYVIGKLLLLDLRNRLSREMGRRFELKRFHDKVLDYGSIPPALIAQDMMQNLRSLPTRKASVHRSKSSVAG